MSVEESRERIWEAVAAEQEALAEILGQEARKATKSADMLDTVPNDVDPDNHNLRIRKVIMIQSTVADVVRATAEKERAIAKKLCAVEGNCYSSDHNGYDEDDDCDDSGFWGCHPGRPRRRRP